MDNTQEGMNIGRDFLKDLKFANDHKVFSVRAKPPSFFCGVFLTMEYLLIFQITDSININN